VLLVHFGGTYELKPNYFIEIGLNLL